MPPRNPASAARRGATGRAAEPAGSPNSRWRWCPDGPRRRRPFAAGRARDIWPHRPRWRPDAATACRHPRRQRGGGAVLRLPRCPRRGLCRRRRPFRRTDPARCRRPRAASAAAPAVVPTEAPPVLEHRLRVQLLELPARRSAAERRAASSRAGAALPSDQLELIEVVSVDGARPARTTQRSLSLRLGSRCSRRRAGTARRLRATLPLVDGDGTPGIGRTATTGGRTDCGRVRTRRCLVADGRGLRPSRLERLGSLVGAAVDRAPPAVAQGGSSPRRAGTVIAAHGRGWRRHWRMRRALSGDGGADLLGRAAPRHARDGARQPFDELLRRQPAAHAGRAPFTAGRMACATAPQLEHGVAERDEAVAVVGHALGSGSRSISTTLGPASPSVCSQPLLRWSRRSHGGHAGQQIHHGLHLGEVELAAQLLSGSAVAACSRCRGRQAGTGVARVAQRRVDLGAGPAVAPRLAMRRSSPAARWWSSVTRSPVCRRSVRPRRSPGADRRNLVPRSPRRRGWRRYSVCAARRRQHAVGANDRSRRAQVGVAAGQASRTRRRR